MHQYDIVDYATLYDMVQAIFLYATIIKTLVPPFTRTLRNMDFDNMRATKATANTHKETTMLTKTEANNVSTQTTTMEVSI